MHPVAFAEPISNLKDGMIDTAPIYFGQIVRCRFNDGPKNGGGLREISYDMMSKRTPGNFQINLDCININMDPNLSNLFNSGGTPIRQLSTGQKVADVYYSYDDRTVTMETEPLKYVGNKSSMPFQFHNKKVYAGTLPAGMLGTLTQPGSKGKKLLKGGPFESFQKLNSAFYKKWGEYLNVTWGYRTFEEQIEILKRKKAS